MNNKLDDNKYKNDIVGFRKLINRYLVFWPYFLISVITFLILSFLYLRYTNYTYQSKSTIEILDKSQDSEMALPTAMTIFNRSMINLDNEVGRLLSFNLNSFVVSQNKNNINYFTIGRIKTLENHKSEFFQDYEIDFNINTDDISFESIFQIDVANNSMNISWNDKKNNTKKYYKFPKLSTDDIKHDLPFNLKINEIGDSENSVTKKIIFAPFAQTVNKFISSLSISQSTKLKNLNSFSDQSDQLDIVIKHANPIIASEYVGALVMQFDIDGITDRQLEYKSTIEFVENRSIFLKKELQLIKDKKKDFKVLKNFNNLDSNSLVSVNQQYIYDSEQFDYLAQKDLLELFKSEIKENETYSLLPIDFGLTNENINTIIYGYNNLVTERNSLLAFGVGINNSYVKNVNNKLDNYRLNLFKSIENYNSSLVLNIEIFRKKEKEFELMNSSLPENEKNLRAIERELEIKEALYLLLLQKKEEAAINYSVVKPTIKIIDSPRLPSDPIFPIKSYIIISAVFLGILTPTIIISLIFFFDNKVHTRNELENLLDSDVPIVGEVPFIKKKEDLKPSLSTTRSVLAESIRIIIANLKFILPSLSNLKKSSVILITSSIKGEGKTLISANIASLLSSQGKTIIIGADLRNPQLHKFYNVEKKIKGLSQILSKNDLDNFRDYLLNEENLDILLSGPIPPNPADLLSQKSFHDLIEILKKEYTNIIIDSAPCLLVSDTIQISKIVDLTLYIFRANHTHKNITNFINDCNKNDKLNNLCLAINSIGNSSLYGYQYGYQYGYFYEYNYGYEYGSKKKVSS